MNSQLLITMLILVLLILIITFENKKLDITQYSINSSKLPFQFDGCRIVLLTDLHNHRFNEHNEQLIKAIDKLHPDYIMIAGDMLTSHIKLDTFNVYELLAQLSSQYEVYYANGNHEQRLALMPETQAAYASFIQSIKTLGVHHLVNEHCGIMRDGSKLFVHGLELNLELFKKFQTRLMEPNELTNSIGINNPDYFNILLAHNPIYFKEYADWGADLVLSGHVHGGMIVLPGLGGVISTQCNLFPKYDFGRFIQGKSTMILSRGLGGHTINVRIGNRPELIMVELKKTLEITANN